MKNWQTPLVLWLMYNKKKTKIKRKKGIGGGNKRWKEKPGRDQIRALLLVVVGEEEAPMAGVAPSFPPQDAPFRPPATAPQQHSMSNAEKAPADAEAATLLVRHLPEAMPQEMLSRLFSHYGASTVRPCAGGK